MSTRNQARASAITKVNKGLSACTSNTALCQNPVSASSAIKSSTSVSRKDTNLAIHTKHAPTVTPLRGPCSMDISLSRSGGGSTSLNETMPSRVSLKSPGVIYIDNADASAVASIERTASSIFHISENLHGTSGNVCKRDLHVGVDTNDKIDPQMCATIACDIYKHLRASENKKRPSTNFMDGVQKDINPSMRAILIDWLVEVAEEYRLVPDTLYLTVNYIDRYLSGNGMNRQCLQLLGVACMMIAVKYEEICAPQVEEFCYITDNMYFKEEVLQMKSAVLNFLKFEMTAPTTKCFLRRFAHAANGSSELECLANYNAELSLLEYNMLCYSPSLIASSAIFLAKYILLPGNGPWNKKRPSTDFMDGVQKDINPSMPAIMIDWLVEVAEEYRLVPDTLTVNYIDRYLSGNGMNRQCLQLLDVACMMIITAKYEEICAPQVEEFCYITDKTYFKEEVLQVESAVLNFLKFEMTAPTTKCFLRRFVHAANRNNELECLVNYVAELSLLEYSMLYYSPSFLAASAVFLAKALLWLITHSTSPQNYVKVLHHHFCHSPSCSLPAIRGKYSQHKYKFVAKKYCPPSEYFHDQWY